MSPQNDSINFIEEGSAKRKEIIGKFLDLEKFEKKFNLAKEDCAEIKVFIKKLEDKNFDEEINKIEVQKNKNTSFLKNCEFDIEKLKCIQEKLNKELFEIDLKIASGPKQEFNDTEFINKQMDTNDKLILNIENVNKIENKKFLEEKNILDGLLVLISNFNYNLLLKDKEVYEKTSKELTLMEFRIKNLLQCKKEKINTILVLKTVPCGDQFPFCRYLIKANNDKTTLPQLEDDILNSQDISRELLSKLISLKESMGALEEMEKLSKDIKNLEKIIVDIELKKEKNNSLLKDLLHQRDFLKKEKQIYIENEIWIQEYRVLINLKNNIKNSISNNLLELKRQEDGLRSALNEVQILKFQYDQILEDKQNLVNYRNEFLVYEFFLKCMGINGIVYDVIKNKLPYINREILKNLENIVDFEVFLEDDGKKLDIYLKNSKCSARAIETCSRSREDFGFNGDKNCPY